jgi:hypothetical protein
VHGRGIEDPIRPRTVRPGFGLRPTVARDYEAEFEQAAVTHRSRAGTNVISELRTNQHDDRRDAGRPKIRAALASRHCDPRSALAAALNPSAPVVGPVRDALALPDAFALKVPVAEDTIGIGGRTGAPGEPDAFEDASGSWATTIPKIGELWTASGNGT